MASTGSTQVRRSVSQDIWYSHTRKNQSFRRGFATEERDVSCHTNTLSLTCQGYLSNFFRRVSTAAVCPAVTWTHSRHPSGNTPITSHPKKSTLANLVRNARRVCTQPNFSIKQCSLARSASGLLYAAILIVIVPIYAIQSGFSNAPIEGANDKQVVSPLKGGILVSPLLPRMDDTCIFVAVF